MKIDRDTVVVWVSPVDGKWHGSVEVVYDAEVGFATVEVEGYRSGGDWHWRRSVVLDGVIYVCGATIDAKPINSGDLKSRGEKLFSGEVAALFEDEFQNWQRGAYGRPDAAAV